MLVGPFNVYHNMPLKEHLTLTIFTFEFIVNLMLLKVFLGAMYFTTEVAITYNW